jgi:hypothetical protein
VPQGVTLTIKPGTVIKFKDNTGFNCGGNLIANGTPDSMIVFTKTDLGLGNINSFVIHKHNVISYAKFQNLNFNRGGDRTEHGFEHYDTGLYDNCVFNQISGSWCLAGGIYKECVITNCRADNSFYKPTIINSNFVNNQQGILYQFTNQSLHIANISASNVFSILLESHNNNFLFSTLYYSESVVDYKSPSPLYLGSSNEKTLRTWIIDAVHPLHPLGSGVVNLDYVAKEPIRTAHGIVWKVVVNGYDAQDEFEMLPPLGVGKHKFEVYFNRPMDTSVAPHISMGVRAPYTQNAIAEDGSWSADSTIYTAYLTITGKTASDGLNRIYVYGAEDDEHFEIPVENMRFNVQVAAAGSLSTGLMAEAGLGKVALTWKTDEEDFEDLLGYNVYRYTTDTAGVSSDTICINKTVIDPQETDFTDYNVKPGETYYYYINQLTTSLTSYSLSNAVAATPMTAQKGDANGSMGVDVADVVTEVSYLTGNNPQPFIFDAADINSDTKINILDIVGTVNIIFNPAATSLGFASDVATYSIEDGILYVETPVVLAGVQFTFTSQQDITPLDALNGFEQVGQWMDEDTYKFIAYSLTGQTLSIGKHALMSIGDAMLEEVILSNALGQNIPAVQKVTTGLSSTEAMQMRLPNPNPFTSYVNIPYIIGKTGEHEVRLVFTNVAGMVVDSYVTKQTFGEYTYTWRAGALSEGVYFVTLYVDGQKMQSEKLIHIR